MAAVAIAALASSSALVYHQTRPSPLKDAKKEPQPPHSAMGMHRPTPRIQLDPAWMTMHRNEASEIAGSLSHGVPAPTTSVARVSQHLNDVSRIEAESHPSARLVQSMLIH